METTKEEREIIKCVGILECRVGGGPNDTTYDPEALEALLRLESKALLVAHIESQILWRDESMPEWADTWTKVGMTCLYESILTGVVKTAPDYRPDEPGPITLAIIDPPGDD